MSGVGTLSRMSYAVHSRPEAGSGFDVASIEAQSIESLERTRSDKWSRYPGCIGSFIAEMDFGLAPCIQRAIVDATMECRLGYIPAPWKREVARACAGWQARHYGWSVSPERIKVVPDVIEAYEWFLREIVGVGGRVIVPTPAYMPFLSLPRLYGVELVEVPMLRTGGHGGAPSGWAFDFEAIESAFRAGCHAFVLCNPHNPIGKVIERSEMLRLSALAERYDVRLFVDEIHAPFVSDGATHIPYASLGETEAAQAMTATSASKSFNIPGVKCAQVLLTNDADLERWIADAEWSEHQTATIGAIATVAAYDEGEAWFADALAYVNGNAAVVDAEMLGRFSRIGYISPRSTYIAWLDFNPVGLHDPARYLRERAKVAMTDGAECGAVGRGCVRMNFAMPRPLLRVCFDRMYRALHEDGLL